MVFMSEIVTTYMCTLATCIQYMHYTYCELYYTNCGLDDHKRA